MGKMEATLKSEIVRLANKELRTVCRPLSRNVRQLKKKVSQLRKAVLGLEKAASLWQKQFGTQQTLLQASEEEVTSARFSAGLIRKLRTRLGLSQQELGTLAGVTAVAVGFWEQGRNRPSGANKAALVALRKLGRREAREILKTREPAKGKPARAARKTKKGRTGAGGRKRRVSRVRRGRRGPKA